MGTDCHCQEHDLNTARVIEKTLNQKYKIVTKTAPKAAVLHKIHRVISGKIATAGQKPESMPVSHVVKSSVNEHMKQPGVVMPMDSKVAAVRNEMSTFSTQRQAAHSGSLQGAISKVTFADSRIRPHLAGKEAVRQKSSDAVLRSAHPTTSPLERRIESTLEANLKRSRHDVAAQEMTKQEESSWDKELRKWGLE